MNDATFTRRLDTAAAGIDNQRWLLADLAAECKRDKYPHWADKIGHHPEVGRNHKTVRQWAQVAEFRHSVGDAIKLPFSHYALALRFLDKLPPARVVELMQTAQAEGVHYEEFRAELRTQAGRPVQHPPTFAALMSDVCMMLEKQARLAALLEKMT